MMTRLEGGSGAPARSRPAKPGRQESRSTTPRDRMVGDGVYAASRSGGKERTVPPLPSPRVGREIPPLQVVAEIPGHSRGRDRDALPPSPTHGDEKLVQLLELLAKPTRAP